MLQAILLLSASGGAGSGTGMHFSFKNIAPLPDDSYVHSMLASMLACPSTSLANCAWKMQNFPPVQYLTDLRKLNSEIARGTTERAYSDRIS